MIARPRDGREGWATVPAFAALDLGTNNCRLLIAHAEGAGFRIVDAFSRIVRLGQGLEASGKLADDAVARAVAALSVCARKIAGHRVAAGRYVATEACRRAANAGAFVARVMRDTGLDIEVIGAEEEARLALSGCRPLLVRERPYGILFDIGGGSTEVIWFRQTDGAVDVVGSVTIPLGVVNCAERFGVDSDDGCRQHVARAVTQRLAPFEARHRIRHRIAAGEVQIIGTSGTVTTLAGVALDLARYDRARVDGTFLAAGQLDAVEARLRAMDVGARAAHPCIGPQRADLVLAGIVILCAIRALLPMPRLRVADRGVREGILWDLTAAHADGSA